MTLGCRSLKSLVAASILLVSGKAMAQSSAFYTNTDMSTTQNTVVPVPANTELIDDIPFSGTYVVDRFIIGYNLPRVTPIANRNINVRFYEPDPTTGYAAASPVFQIELTNVNVRGLDIEDIDLAALGESFQWTAGTTFGGEQGGLLSLQFDPGSNGNWYLADGGGSSNIYQVRNYSGFGSGFPSTGSYSDALYQYYLGPNQPLEGSFYAVLYGHAVPEPSAGALLLGTGLMALTLLRRHRQRIKAS